MSGSHRTTAGAPPDHRAPSGDPVPPGDRELTRRLRRSYARGVLDADVCDLLYRRHRGALLACARGCCRAPQDAEDLVSEAFVRTFQAVRAGGGPRDEWRPYLLAVVRHTAIEWRTGDGLTVLTPDVESWCAPGPSGEDPQQRLLSDEERRLAARSFHALPARWKAVLWHTLVEDDCRHQVPSLFGITPSAVTSLAFRAREGLREAYLYAHLGPAATGDARCRPYAPMLGAAVRRRSLPRAGGLRRHLAGCGSCSRAYAELLDLDASMAAHASDPGPSPR
ncbi:RNA polymerase sigma factor [Streptomyces sp. A1136]|uniref:RNA polymerase sigma factor n=1 Tax=Streptomyces sp. A1136 TaxID=2563102 RepID=UPI00109EE2C3|nr:sigma-70 family RNA polymerase sigma factor [Streptomyces sp. A1136]THA56796.1 sigma-70 family RNA polymerase sigma factor [Streptomyces sp. A1136]